MKSIKSNFSIIVWFLLLLVQECLMNEVKKTFHNYYRVISNKELQQSELMADNFIAHFNKNQHNQDPKKLTQVSININQNISYQFVYQNSLNQKNIINIKPINQTFFALSSSQGHKKIIKHISSSSSQKKIVSNKK